MVGKNIPAAWPPRSPDFYPCDLCLRDWMKQLVYGSQQCPQTIEKLQRRVEVAAVLRRAEACIANQGQHFQHYCK